MSRVAVSTVGSHRRMYLEIPAYRTIWDAGSRVRRPLRPRGGQDAEAQDGHGGQQPGSHYSVRARTRNCRRRGFRAGAGRPSQVQVSKVQRAWLGISKEPGPQSTFRDDPALRGAFLSGSFYPSLSGKRVGESYPSGRSEWGLGGRNTCYLSGREFKREPRQHQLVRD